MPIGSLCQYQLPPLSYLLPLSLNVFKKIYIYEIASSHLSKVQNWAGIILIPPLKYPLEPPQKELFTAGVLNNFPCGFDIAGPSVNPWVFFDTNNLFTDYLTSTPDEVILIEGMTWHLMSCSPFTSPLKQISKYNLFFSFSAQYFPIFSKSKRNP